jgi:anaerobic selenocysteine-containing dehydrogenase
VLPCAGQLERADLPHVIDTYIAAVATQYTPAVVPPAAERRPMWRIFAELGERRGMTLLPRGLRAEEATDDDVLAPMAARARMTFEELRTAGGGVLAEEAVFGWVTERVLPGGRWRVAPEPLLDQLRTLVDPPPLVLVPRRQLRHLNSQLARTGTKDGRRDQPLLLLHPADAADAGVEDGQLVRVTSATGELACVAAIDPDGRRGTVSVPHGHGEVNVNHLTSGVDLDPLTGMVLQSGVAVTLAAAGRPPAAGSADQDDAAVGGDDLAGRPAALR